MPFVAPARRPNRGWNAAITVTCVILGGAAGASIGADDAAGLAANGVVGALVAGFLGRTIVTRLQRAWRIRRRLFTRLQTIVEAVDESLTASLLLVAAVWAFLSTLEPWITATTLGFAGAAIVQLRGRTEPETLSPKSPHELLMEGLGEITAELIEIKRVLSEDIIEDFAAIREASTSIAETFDVEDANLARVVPALDDIRAAVADLSRQIRRWEGPPDLR
jgi:hypothetical protein